RRFDPFSVGIHDPVTLRDDSIEMPNRGLAKSIDMIRGWRRKTALHDHAVAFPCASVANGAVDVEPLPATLKKVPRQRYGKRYNQIRSDLPPEKPVVLIQMPAGNSVSGERPRSHVVILKEIASLERPARRLLEHIAATGGCEHQETKQ